MSDCFSTQSVFGERAQFQPVRESQHLIFSFIIYELYNLPLCETFAFLLDAELNNEIYSETFKADR